MLYYSLVIVLLLEYLRPSAYVPALEVLRLNSVFPIFVIIGSMFSGGRTSHEDVLRERNTHILLFFLFLVTVSVLTATVTEWAWNMWRVVCGYVLLSCATFKIINTEERLRGAFKAMVLVHLAVAILNPQVLLNPSQRGYTGSSFLGDGNDYALSLNVAVPMCLYLVFSAAKARQRWFYSVVLIILVLCIVATQSRGGTIALAGVALFYWYQSEKKLRTAAMFAVIVTAILLFAPPEYYERMNSISTQEGSAQGRIEAWKGAWRMALDSPLLGFGAGHFPFVYGANYRSSFDGPHVQTAHSIYFLALGEFGFPGMMCLLYFMWSNFAANRRLAQSLGGASSGGRPGDRNLLMALSASLIAYAIAGAFLSALYYPHLYVLSGFLAAGRRIVADNAAAATDGLPAVVKTKPAATAHWALLPRPAGQLLPNRRRRLAELDLNRHATE